MPYIMNFFQLQTLLSTGGLHKVHVVDTEETGIIVDINPSEEKILVETEWEEDIPWFGGSTITHTYKDQYWVSPEDIVLI